MTSFSFGLLCLSSLITIIDPLATAPLFISLTQGCTVPERRAVAGRACRVALVLLLVFAVGGSTILKVFGITIHAFRIAGGLLFFGTGAGMLRGGSHAQPSQEDDVDLAIVPLAMPLICGPGALSTVMVLMGQATSVGQVLAFFVALVLAVLLTWLCLLAAPRALRMLGKSGIVVLTQVLGLILCVIGVQFVADGIRPLLQEIL